MVQDIFIGVDGGGTKSKIRIEDQYGKILGQAVSGPANIRLSVDQAWHSIYAGIHTALELVGLELQDTAYHFHIGLGLAGCEVREAYNDFLSRSHPFKTIQLASDAYVACVGAHELQDGAIIIVGTGVVGYQIEHQHQSKVGGWGFPHDDEGGGAWLGLEAAKLTFQWLDHRIEKSALVEDIFAFFNQDIATLTTWANQANATEFARLAPIVINHSQQEEIQAVRLMKKAAHAVDRISAALIKLQKKESQIPCCLFGGVAPFIEPWLGEELRARLVPRKLDANGGAILMIKNWVQHAVTNGS